MKLSYSCHRTIISLTLITDAEAPEIQKYDRFIPHSILRKAFASDYLDMEELKQQVEKWQFPQQTIIR